MVISALWAGRDVTDVEAAMTQGLTWMADNMNAAGCLSYWDPWGMLEMAGQVDHPLARRIVEKQVPMILRAQRSDGGWGEHSFQVFQALARYDLLEQLRGLPPQPPDWRVVHSLPLPEGDYFGATWLEGRLWVGERKRNEALALSRRDGRVVARLPLPAGKPRWLGSWRDELVLTQGDPWAGGEKRLLLLDAQDGTVERELSLDKFTHVGGATEVNGQLWIVDSFFGWLDRVDPEQAGTPEPDPGDTLAGPMPCYVTPANGGVWHCDVWAPAIIKSDFQGRFLDWGERPFGWVQGLAWDGRHLWALDSDQKRLCEIEKAADR